MVRSARVAEQGCRSDSSDVRGQGPTDGLLTEPREPGQSPQQSVPCAQGRDSLDATQALQHRRRLLHAPAIGRRRLSYATRAFFTDAALASSSARTTASTKALFAPWPRFGGMAWAASPSKTRRPENQRRQSTRRTVFSSRSSKDDTLSNRSAAAGSTRRHSWRKAPRSRRDTASAAAATWAAAQK